MNFLNFKPPKFCWLKFDLLMSNAMKYKQEMLFQLNAGVFIAVFKEFHLSSICENLNRAIHIDLVN